MTSSIRERARAVLEDAWRPEGGYCSPNLETYPWLWLWDSCFHSVVWAALGDLRAVTEIESVFRWQTDEGFVPHMGYQLDPAAATEIWGQPGASTITQPPMWGHAARVLVEFGFDLPAGLTDRMWAGLDWIWDHRRRGDAVVVCHPWETGCDDSPRWRAGPATSWDRPGWMEEKRRLVGTLDIRDRAAVANPDWEVGSAGFQALMAFNLRELSAVAPRQGRLDRAEVIEAGLARRFDGEIWRDEPAAGEAVPVLDALLPLLVIDGDFRLLQPYAATFGPRYLPHDHPSYDPDTYWRGPAWPQLTYLLWVAAARRGDPTAATLAENLVSGAEVSGWAEYWNPETGRGGGARPQSWTGLAAVVV